MKHCETPVAIYTSMKIFAIVRSRTLIDNLIYFRICVPYSRILDITNEIRCQLLQQYEKDNIFLPKLLRKELFTVITKDNIGLNASSTTAEQHYHGTCTSALSWNVYVSIIVERVCQSYNLLQNSIVEGS